MNFFLWFWANNLLGGNKIKTDLNIYYCFIKADYLNKVYDSELIIKGKYQYRPFVYFGDLGIAIAIPQITNHKVIKYNDNVYFDNDNYYLDIGSFIYVNKEHINFSNWMNSNPEKIKLLKEIKAKLHVVIDKILYVEYKASKFLKYNQKHKQIELSKKFSKNKK